jgi:GTP-binding protein HflX
MIIFVFMIEKTDLSFEKAVLVGIVTKDQNEDKLEEYLDELEFLTFTAGGEVQKRFTQKMDMPNPKTLLEPVRWKRCVNSWQNMKLVL